MSIFKKLKKRSQNAFLTDKKMLNWCYNLNPITLCYLEKHEEAFLPPDPCKLHPDHGTLNHLAKKDKKIVTINVKSISIVMYNTCNWFKLLRSVLLNSNLVWCFFVIVSCKLEIVATKLSLPRSPQFLFKLNYVFLFSSKATL